MRVLEPAVDPGSAGAGQILAPAKTLDEMQRVIFNDWVDAALCALFVAVVVAMLFYGIAVIRLALASPHVTTHEVGAVAATAS